MAVDARCARGTIIVCGAGAAGLAAAATLQRVGLAPLVLEQSGEVATSWRRRYDGLRLNTLGWMSTLPGHHAGRRPKHFPTRDEWVQYLERYAQHHRLQIQFNTHATTIERDRAGWRVNTTEGPFAAKLVVVATGYDHDPYIPAWPGRETFTGELHHADDYRNPAPFQGRDVLVVGANTSGTEIATFLAAGGARRVRVAVRTPPNLLAREWLGMPLNPAALLLDRLPLAAADQLGRLTQRVLFGDLHEYGLEQPPLGIKSSLAIRHIGPAFNDGFLEAIAARRIELVAAVERIDGPALTLANTMTIHPEVVIAATGYRRGLEPLVGHLGVLDRQGRPTVHAEANHPAAPGLYFIGYRTQVSGQLRQMRIDAKRIATGVAKTNAGPTANAGKASRAHRGTEPSQAKQARIGATS